MSLPCTRESAAAILSGFGGSSVVPTERSERLFMTHSGPRYAKRLRRSNRQKCLARLSASLVPSRLTGVRVNRRAFIALATGAFVCPRLAAEQPGTRKRRVGILMPYAETDAESRRLPQALRDALAQTGWVEEGNIQFDVRWATDNMDRIRADALSLVASSPDVIVAIGGRVVPILMKASSSIPIVVPGTTDPVGIGWVQSLARPGGNVT